MNNKKFPGLQKAKEKRAAVLIPPFRLGSRSSTDMAAESSQRRFLLLAVFALSIFGKAATAFVFPF